jgi:hypothetical protein
LRRLVHQADGNAGDHALSLGASGRGTVAAGDASPDPLAGMTGADFDKAAAKIQSGKWRENAQAKDWVGKAIAEALDLNIANKPERAKVSGMIKAWLAAGSLIIVKGEDEKRMSRKFVEVREEA